MYHITEKLAYSFVGKAIAKTLQKTMYKNNRVHWIQQAITDMDFSSLR